MDLIPNLFDCPILAELESALHDLQQTPPQYGFGTNNCPSYLWNVTRLIEKAVDAGDNDTFGAIKAALYWPAITHEYSALHNQLAVSSLQSKRKRLKTAILAAHEVSQRASFDHQRALKVNAIVASEPLKNTSAAETHRFEDMCTKVFAEIVADSVKHLQHRLHSFVPDAWTIRDFPPGPGSQDRKDNPLACFLLQFEHKPHKLGLNAIYKRLFDLTKELHSCDVGWAPVLTLFEHIAKLDRLTREVRSSINTLPHVATTEESYRQQMIGSLTAPTGASNASGVMNTRRRREVEVCRAYTLLRTAEPQLIGALIDTVKAIKTAGESSYSPLLRRLSNILQLRADTLVCTAHDVLKTAPRMHLEWLRWEAIDNAFQAAMELARG